MPNPWSASVLLEWQLERTDLGMMLGRYAYMRGSNQFALTIIIDAICSNPIHCRMKIFYMSIPGHGSANVIARV